jgi:hypothetical protein
MAANALYSFGSSILASYVSTTIRNPCNTSRSLTATRSTSRRLMSCALGSGVPGTTISVVCWGMRLPTTLTS